MEEHTLNLMVEDGESWDDIFENLKMTFRSREIKPGNVMDMVIMATTEGIDIKLTLLYDGETGLPDTWLDDYYLEGYEEDE